MLNVVPRLLSITTGDAVRIKQFCFAAPFTLIVCLGMPASFAQTTITYDDAVTKARKLLDDGKLGEAYLAASAAVTLDDKRWEAYGVIALALGAQGNNAEAVTYTDKALAVAP